MKKFLSLFMIILMVLSFAAITSGCSSNAKTSSAENAKKASQTASGDKETKGNTQKDINDFILKNTKIVKVFSITKRVNPKTPNLGPLDVVRGIDERGQKSEVWVKDNKIYEMSSIN
jgi:basic membrane lipoprotein Med (substrate-binding protein (PBP1-ABC) superfamily)